MFRKKLGEILSSHIPVQSLCEIILDFAVIIDVIPELIKSQKKSSYKCYTCGDYQQYISHTQELGCISCLQWSYCYNASSDQDFCILRHHCYVCDEYNCDHGIVKAGTYESDPNVLCLKCKQGIQIMVQLRTKMPKTYQEFYDLMINIF